MRVKIAHDTFGKNFEVTINEIINTLESKNYRIVNIKPHKHYAIIMYELKEGY